MPQKYFDKVDIGGLSLADYLSGRGEAKDLFTLKRLVEYCQVLAGLLIPYDASYPLIEPRELQPPFDLSLWEYKELPGFSMLALDRQLDYQAEPFQFDILKDPTGSSNPESIRKHNQEVLLSRLPRPFHPTFFSQLGWKDITTLEHYTLMLSYLFRMDRAHLVARGNDDTFRLAGIFASFPSDLDREIKQFGFKIGKFRPRDNQLYEKNRLFVYRYLMELHGYPIASERRTSAALFSRRLADFNENYFITVLGNSDRTLTFMSSRGRGRLPMVEKIALVRISPDETELFDELEQNGWMVDRQRRVIILKVTYAQHNYNPENIVEDRALSVVEQEAIHPRTGRRLSGLNLFKTTRSRLVRLNDIVRGEHLGHIVFQGQEIIHGTEDHSSRLKFLYSWLSKHRRTILGYAPRTFSQVCRTLESYLNDDKLIEDFERQESEYALVRRLVSVLKQEYEVLLVKRAITNSEGGKRPSYLKRLQLLLDFLSRKHDLAKYDPEVFDKAMLLFERFLGSPYFARRYLNPAKKKYSDYEKEVLELFRQVMLQKSDLEWEYHRITEASSAV